MSLSNLVVSCPFCRRQYAMKLDREQIEREKKRATCGRCGNSFELASRIVVARGAPGAPPPPPPKRASPPPLPPGARPPAPPSVSVSPPPPPRPSREAPMLELVFEPEAEDAQSAEATAAAEKGSAPEDAAPLDLAGPPPTAASSDPATDPHLAPGAAEAIEPARSEAGPSEEGAPDADALELGAVELGAAMDRPPATDRPAVRPVERAAPGSVEAPPDDPAPLDPASVDASYDEISVAAVASVAAPPSAPRPDDWVGRADPGLEHLVTTPSAASLALEQLLP